MNEEVHPVGTGKLIVRLQDALDHIWRIANMSNQMSKRTYWISARARSALDGDEKWREFDYPRNRKRESENWRKRAKAMEPVVAAAQAFFNPRTDGGDEIEALSLALQNLEENDADKHG